jgi:putative cobalt transporter subunit CbtA
MTGRHIANSFRFEFLAAREALRPGDWLRIALLAGLAAAAVAIVFDLAIGERILDRAVGLEAHHHGSLATPEPFSRSGQRGGLVAGGLILGAGVAFLLAGAATLLGGRARSPRRLWILTTAAATWGVVVLPALVYPPLPPGVHSAVAIGERQLLYLAVVAVGISGFAAAVHLWSTMLRLRQLLAVAAGLVPAALCVALLPDAGADTSRLSAGLLIDFRIVSVASQLLFWSAIAGAGALLLPAARRTVEPLTR